MITEEKKELLAHYNEGLALYRKKEWDEAIACFQRALAIDANDGPSNLYIDRCNNYKVTPPPADWDGVFVMTTK